MALKKILSTLLILLILSQPIQALGQEGILGPGAGQSSSGAQGPAGPGAGLGPGLGGLGPGPGPGAAPGLGPSITGPSPAAPSPTGPDLKSQAEFFLQRIGGEGPAPTPQISVPGQAPQPTPTPAPAQPKGPQEVERLKSPLELTPMENRSKFQGMNLRLFGYDLFRQPPSSFLPVTAIPVGPDYLIGPGDTIRIIIWGSIQGEYNLTVDRNGQVAIPKVGVVQVSGLTFQQLQQVMDREFGRQYNNFQMNVTLDNLRTIRVYVVGQAASPGSYAISSLSTLINGLLASGGPNANGSLRDIQLRRQGRVIVHFDLYDFLLRGVKTNDIRLMPEDVIFIPLAAQRAGIGGPVRTPAIFELKNERTLSDLIGLAGGLDSNAFKSRVQILRIQNRREMVLMEDDLEKFLTGCLPDINLQDGDLIKIFPVPSVSIKTVRVEGIVQNPGEFGYRDNMRVKDLITFAGGFMLQTNLEDAELTRVSVSSAGPETTRIHINLRSAMAGNARDNILLKPNDFLFVRSVPDWSLYKLVGIRGEVKYPGNYTIKKGETLSSVLSRAGGFTDNAFPKGAFFYRVAVQRMQAEHLKQALDRLEAEMLSTTAQASQVALEQEDVARQKALLTQQQQFLAKMRNIQPLGRVVIQIDDPERLRGTPDDLELQEGDYLWVPPIQQTVNVLGSVVNPTAVVYDPYMTVRKYIAQAGGPTKHADIDRAYVIKVNGSALGGKGGIIFGSRVASSRLEPGDTIVVPENFDQIPWLKTVKDVSTILGQFALMAGVVFAALK